MSLGFIESEWIFYSCLMLIYISHDFHGFKCVPNASRPCDLLLSRATMRTFTHHLLCFAENVYKDCSASYIELKRIENPLCPT